MDSVPLPETISSPSESMSMLDLEVFENPSGISSKTVKGQTQIPKPSRKVHDDENILLDFSNDNKVSHKPDPSPTISNHGTSNSVSGTTKTTICPTSDEVKRLLSSTKEIDLDKVDLIENMAPLDLDIGDDCGDVNLTLTFGTCSGFPSSVKVAVVTLTNRSPSASVLNYVFQLMPPKGLLVRIHTNCSKLRNKR